MKLIPSYLLTVMAVVNLYSQPKVVINLNQVAYPALTKKFGINFVWNDAKSNLVDDMTTTTQSKMPIMSGLWEFSTIADNAASSTSTLGSIPFNTNNPNPFTRVGQSKDGQIETHLNPNMTLLRNALWGDNKVVGFMQLCGIPSIPNYTSFPIFQPEPDVSASSNGNYYPLPIDLQKQEYANGLADLIKNYRADGKPTIWSFWQEPDHTLGIRNLTSRKDYDMNSTENTSGTTDDIDTHINLIDYAKFYRQIALAMKANDQTYSHACCQQNQAAGGGKASNGPLDGDQYTWMVNAMVDAEATLSPSSGRTPFDYWTIQNYNALLANRKILANARYALTNNSKGINTSYYDNVALIMNEYAMAKNNQTDYWGPDPASLIQSMNEIKFLIGQSDLTHMMLPPALLKPNPSSLFKILSFYNTMPSITRLSTPENTTDLDCIASSDENHFAFIIWNKTSSPITNFSVDISGVVNPNFISSGEAQKTFSTKQFVGSIETDGTTVPQKNGTTLTFTYTLPANGIWMVEIGGEDLFQNFESSYTYKRQFTMCYRTTGTIESGSSTYFSGNPSTPMPGGNGVYDTRTNTFWLSTAQPSSARAIGTTLFESSPSGLPLHFNITREGNSPEAKIQPLYIRLDYINDNETSAKTIFFRNPNAPEFLDWSTLHAPWLPTTAAEHVTITTNSLLQATEFGYDVYGNAPAGWNTNRLLVTAYMPNDAGTEAIAGIRLSVGDIVTAIEENYQTKKLTIFPNPAKNEFKISEEVVCKKVEIINLQGILLQSYYDTNHIRLNNISPGIYLVKVESFNTIQTLKLIIE